MAESQLNGLQRQTGSLVSIVTPTHNAERFIRETIRSVQAQDHDNWEMLVVDDASSDCTRDIVRDLAALDSRIRLTARTYKAGPGSARNTGFAQARGRYIAFLDSDDLWLPQKLSIQLAFMQEHNAGFVYSDYGLINENGDQIGNVIRAPPTLDYQALLRNPIIGCLTVVVDRDKIGLPEMLLLPLHEDFAMWCSILKRGGIACGIQQELARHRILARSRSENKLRCALHMWKVYRQVEKLELPYALWCYVHYAARAYQKNRGVLFRDGIAARLRRSPPRLTGNPEDKCGP